MSAAKKIMSAASKASQQLGQQGSADTNFQQPLLRVRFRR